MGQLSAGMLDILNALYRHELTNHLVYRQYQSRAAFQGLDGFEKWLKGQAEGEMGHAQKVYDYILTRNEEAEPAPFSFSATLQSERFPDIFGFVLELERGTTAAWAAAYAQALEERDYLTAQWIMDPAGLMAEQREEENIAQTIVDRIAVRGADPAAIHDLDVWLGGLA
jgi:ferritin